MIYDEVQLVTPHCARPDKNHFWAETAIGPAPYRVAAATACVIAASLLLALLTAPGPDFIAILGPADDRLADYFKFILSYPGGAQVVAGPSLGLQDLIKGYQTNNPFHDASTFTGTGASHLLAPPLMTLFCLLNVAAMQSVEPALCYAVLVLLVAERWVSAVVRTAADWREAMAWAMAGLLSYPMVFMVARGNVYAGLTAVLIISALLLAAERRAPLVAALLLALAVNFRPNAIVLMPALLLLHPSAAARSLIAFVGGAGLVFGSSLLAAHAVYPGYTLASFQKGLHLYYNAYVVGDDGLAFGSSLYGGLKFLIGYRPALDLIALIPALGCLTAAIILGLARVIRPGPLIFLITASYCLGSSVIADYHLFTFMVPAMLCGRALERVGWSAPEGIGFLASCVMLVPLNYVFTAGVSWQVVLHPAVLLVAAIAIIGPALNRPTISRAFATLVRLNVPMEAAA